ncbi:hypothetical protein A3G56_01210 [Candidatus Falkowbacteria bacterium RIFCSPLOWO2_12_FULL_45_10]|uniref:Uncharacterized protein n=1 Tax=Candidatus Falkowbacteria bacterium RIFCSPLOWO2_12_FULL_45_10 TaxID=1797990 RepID=A0A1F5RX14_9BACT|nr:MAG: hypothetical protein A3G56_01210 [Candidatus Falkowbacteria bacterium RIFCSPLOWO2_12_FULL_45_10]
MLKIKYKKQNDRKGDKIMDKIMREKIGLCAKMLFFRMLTSIYSLSSFFSWVFLCQYISGRTEN